MSRLTLIAFALVPALSIAALQTRGGRPDPEEISLAFLAREVPRWAEENRCYSCHNNGDAARALYQAIRLSYPVPAAALADTTQWLSQPSRWDDNKGDPRFSDKGLARVQFTAALVEALETGHLRDHGTLREAARLLIEHQREDGSWQQEDAGILGSPATYGVALATAMACRSLRYIDRGRFSAEIDRADKWLLSIRPRNVPDAVAVLLGLAGSNGDGTRDVQKNRCRSFLLEAQSRDGGWGPYPRTPAEPFDTSLAILGLASLTDSEEVREALRRGRKFLLSLQNEDGSWPETTRPPGAESYAQRISTAGWAVQALLATRALQ